MPHAQPNALGRDRTERQAGYRELFRYHLDYGDLYDIRESLSLGSVLGSDYFKDQIERVLMRGVRPNKVGRPKLDRINEPFIHYYVNRL